MCIRPIGIDSMRIIEMHGDKCSQCQDYVGVCNDTDYQIHGCESGLKTNSAANEHVKFEASADKIVQNVLDINQIQLYGIFEYSKFMKNHKKI